MSDLFLNILRSINYPGLMVTSLIISGLCVLYHTNYRREFVAIVASFFFLTSGIAYAMLALTTGLKPMYELAPFSPWIQVTRSVQLLITIWLIVLLARRALSAAPSRGES